jgi:hypothetical protein
MRGLTLTILVLLQSLCACAQFSDSLTHHARFAASGNLNRSNSITAYLLSNEARYGVRKKRTTLNAVANWLYGEQGGRLTNNDFTSTADFNLYRDSSKLYYWALGNYTTSYSLKIRNQWQSGLGLAYNFVNTPTAWLNVSNGILYEKSRLSTSDPAINQYHTFRNSLRLAYRFVIRKNVTVNGSNFFQPALGRGNDYIVRTSNSLAIKLNQWISIGTTVSYNQFKRTGTENLLFTYGVVAEKFF